MFAYVLQESNAVLNDHFHVVLFTKNDSDECQ